MVESFDSDDDDDVCSMLANSSTHEQLKRKLKWIIEVPQMADSLMFISIYE